MDENMTTNQVTNDDKWGLVLCGGGAKGAYQIGSWKALEEYGLFSKVKGFSGDSIGAINEMIMASMTQAAGEDLWESINFLTVFDTEPDLIDMEEGTFSRNEMLSIMRHNINYTTLANDSRDLFVNITKMGPYGLEEGSVAVYEKLNNKSAERIEKIVLASSALPIIYEAVEMDGALYRDGGMTDNMPIKPLYDAGYRKIIVIALSHKATINTDLYPDCEILLIRPSQNLGDLIDGTLNFKTRDIKMRMEMGYRDTLRTLKAYFEKDPAYLAQLDILAQMDNQDILVNSKMQSLNDRVTGHMDKLDSIINKYSI